VYEDVERCRRAVASKDSRFDGWFVTAVLTTGIYCRPSCPVRPPREKNMRFYPTAAAAQKAGFRACKRCRPDASPGSPEWNIRADVTARAMRLITDGVVDREGVTGLAARLGYSSRQMERLLLAEVGAGPLAIARAQRAQAARTLIETTTLSFAEVAFGAGFASIRQFNDTVREVFALTPTELRARATHGGVGSAPHSISLRLPFRLPLSPDSLFGHLAATMIPGVEEVAGETFRRVLRLPNGTAVVALTPTPDHISCTLTLDDHRDLQSAIARCRRLLDLDADPEAVDDALSADAALRDVVRKIGGVRIPRCVDEHEMAVRVVLGQQVSTGAASRHLHRLAEAVGPAVEDAGGGLSRAFPTAAELAECDLSVLRMPASRRDTVRRLVDALAAEEVDLSAGADWAVARERLREIKGIGTWTVEMIAMRALGDPDAFPSNDLGVLRGAHSLGLPTSPRELELRAERWRPWRSYVVQHLWAATPHSVNDWPIKEKP
jgi:AraC family transcriptional regulator of adaptative response / DNA-3-methyladenine glycosylase II